MNRTEYEEKRDKLFESWKQEKNYDDLAFVKDGILFYESWCKQQIRVLFLLKETFGNFTDFYAKDNNDRISITDGDKNKSPFWWNIARWKLALDKKSQNQDCNYPKNNELPKYIDDIAIIDIKKIDEDKRRSYPTEIRNYAKKDKIYLRQQIELINPQLIICGGTFDYYQIIYDNNVNQKIEVLAGVKPPKKNSFVHNNRIVIDFYHPGYKLNKGGTETLFDEFLNLLNSTKIFDELNILKSNP